MKTWPILAMTLEREGDVVAVRQRARRISELLGFDIQDQTRIATSVSEIARNAYAYAGGGRTEFRLEGLRTPERFMIRVVDRGPGLVDLDAVLEGRTGSSGLGVTGARRLMDAFTIESQAGVGTTVAMGKALPPAARLTPERLAQIAKVLTQEAAADPMTELRAQNQELMRSLEALEAERLEAAHLGEELERTNKGVVALYAELDRRADQLQQLNSTLEDRVAAAIADRELVEQRLRQSQKMEAVGQLTGGIAHDFNNLLMIIGGSLEMLRRRVPAEAAIIRLLDAASQSVARGAQLNHQLLAFARRQDLREETICVGELAAGFRDLIDRAISEDIAIRLETQPGPWYCRTDPHQLETAMLNLAINARDAMPDGGVITLSIANTSIGEGDAQVWEGSPGDYVVVSVADTGSGMAPEVMKHVFEPFFTTKEVGRGTGLGLSQVYGFAKQSGGFVSLTSEPGAGARVSIHLPRANKPTVVVAAAPEVARRVGGDATILVVEDDVGVRMTTSGLLRDLGYTIIEVGTAQAALDALDGQAIDLVLTDVILPDGMSGLELATALRQTRPGLPVLLTSGYTAQRIGLAAEGQRLALLQKPYSEAQLSEAVREALRS